ncbi:MAG: hypothetical protein WCR67_05340, partial [Bacilli bacterium]
EEAEEILFVLYSLAYGFENVVDKPTVYILDEEDDLLRFNLMQELSLLIKENQDTSFKNIRSTRLLFIFASLLLENDGQNYSPLQGKEILEKLCSVKSNPMYIQSLLNIYQSESIEYMKDIAIDKKDFITKKNILLTSISPSEISYAPLIMALLEENLGNKQELLQKLERTDCSQSSLFLANQSPKGSSERKSYLLKALQKSEQRSLKGLMEEVMVATDYSPFSSEAFEDENIIPELSERQKLMKKLLSYPHSRYFTMRDQELIGNQYALDCLEVLFKKDFFYSKLNSRILLINYNPEELRERYPDLVRYFESQSDRIILPEEYSVKGRSLNPFAFDNNDNSWLNSISEHANVCVLFINDDFLDHSLGGRGHLVMSNRQILESHYILPIKNLNISVLVSSKASTTYDNLLSFSNICKGNYLPTKMEDFSFSAFDSTIKMGSFDKAITFFEKRQVYSLEKILSNGIINRFKNDYPDSLLAQSLTLKDIYVYQGNKEKLANFLNPHANKLAVCDTQIIGAGGRGKTSLIASIVSQYYDDFEFEMDKREEKVPFFYFNKQIIENINFDQISNFSEILLQRIKSYYVEEEISFDVIDYLLLNYPSIYVFVDGYDEIDERVLNRFFILFATLKHQYFNLRLSITTRNDLREEFRERYGIILENEVAEIAESEKEKEERIKELFSKILTVDYSIKLNYSEPINLESPSSFTPFLKVLRNIDSSLTDNMLFLSNVVYDYIVNKIQPNNTMEVFHYIYHFVFEQNEIRKIFQNSQTVYGMNTELFQKLLAQIGYSLANNQKDIKKIVKEFAETCHLEYYSDDIYSLLSYRKIIHKDELTYVGLEKYLAFRHLFSSEVLDISFDLERQEKPSPISYAYLKTVSFLYKDQHLFINISDDYGKAIEKNSELINDLKNYLSVLKPSEAVLGKLNLSYEDFFHIIENNEYSLTFIETYEDGIELIIKSLAYLRQDFKIWKNRNKSTFFKSKNLSASMIQKDLQLNEKLQKLFLSLLETDNEYENELGKNEIMDCFSIISKEV